VPLDVVLAGLLGGLDVAVALDVVGGLVGVPHAVALGVVGGELRGLSSAVTAQRAVRAAVSVGPLTEAVL